MVKAAADQAQPQGSTPHDDKAVEAQVDAKGDQGQINTQPVAPKDQSGTLRGQSAGPTEEDARKFKPSAQRKKADVILHAKQVIKVQYPYELGVRGKRKEIPVDNPDYSYAEQSVYPANVFEVAAHGSRKGMADRGNLNSEEEEVNDTHYFTFEEIVAAIDAGGYVSGSGQPIYLAACHTAGGRNSLAIQVARHYKTLVLGFTDEAVNDSRYQMGMKPAGEERNKDGMITRRGSGRLRGVVPESE